jgi:hypothetical protein
MAGEITLKLTIKGGADGSFTATIDSARKSIQGLGDEGDQSSRRVTAGFNGTADGHSDGQDRSIPACAGEPLFSQVVLLDGQVDYSIGSHELRSRQKRHFRPERDL